jgi:hypothetical protein
LSDRSALIASSSASGSSSPARVLTAVSRAGLAPPSACDSAENP